MILLFQSLIHSHERTTETRSHGEINRTSGVAHTLATREHKTAAPGRAAQRRGANDRRWSREHAIAFGWCVRATIFDHSPHPPGALGACLRASVSPWPVRDRRSRSYGRKIAALGFVAWIVGAAPSAQTATRVVSLIPALTDMVVAMGGRSQLVAVSSYDDEPDVKGLPRVGALLDPDVERIISLRPDLVLVYGSQTDLITQLGRASIPFYEYRHGGLTHVTGTIRELGKRLGRSAASETLASTIESRIEAVRRKTASRPKPKTMLVFGRERGTLRGIYVSGGQGFLHDMLEAAGGTNVFGDTKNESVEVSTELILTRAPEVIIELRSTDIPSPTGRRLEIDSWNALASVPAVRTKRVHLLVGKQLVVPGPLVADGVEEMARVLHPELFK